MLEDHVYALHQGARLNQYEISNVLGAGGFGITYLAKDMSLEAPVAIKEYLPNDLATRQDGSQVTAKSSTAVNDFKWGLDRFMDEARVLAKFRHQNIVHVNQVFEANNTAYIVMEYAKGESLSDYLQRHLPLTEAQTKDILLPIIDGLKKVHEQGFLHRDIKPGNIILRDEEGPVLIDFGAARHAIETKSRSITSIITEGYAPLEQYDPKGNQGPWTDVYALGAVAYKCLTGNTPPAATSRVRNDPLAPLSVAAKGRVSKEFASSIEWALSVYEDQRPQTVDEFACAIGGDFSTRNSTISSPEATRLMRASTSSPVGAGVTQMIREPSLVSDLSQLGPAIGPQGLSRTMLIAVAGGAVLLVILGIGGWYWATHRVAPEDQRAWETAAQTDTIAAYQLYQREEPDGYYSDRAASLISERENEIDTAWANAQRQGAAAAVQAFITKYGNEGRHLSEAQTLLPQLQEKERQARAAAEAKEQAILEQNQAIERKLQDAGSYTGTITGAQAETVAAIKSYQQSKGLPITGTDDSATQHAIDRDIARNRIIQEAYQRATERHSRAGYSAFLAKYGSSSYAPNIRSRLAQCHIQTTPHSSMSSDTIQNTGNATAGNQGYACNQSRSVALNSLQASCGNGGGRLQNPRVTSENAVPNFVGTFLKHVFGQHGNGGIQCTSTVQAECVKEVTTDTQAEICP